MAENGKVAIALGITLIAALFARYSFHSTITVNRPPLGVVQKFIEITRLSEKHWLTPAENNYRLEVFRQNNNQIDQFNKDYNAMLERLGHSPLEEPMFALNPFSLKTDEEISATSNGLSIPKEGLLLSSNPSLAAYSPNDSDSATSSSENSTKNLGLLRKPFEYRIKDQRECGGCWSFSAALSLEKYALDLVGVQFDFSMQYMIDCDLTNNGCSGGWPTRTFQFIQESGIPTLSLYPFANAETNCKSPPRKFSFGKKLQPDEWLYNHKTLLGLLNSGIYPSISFHASRELYSLSSSSAPYIPLNCGQRVNHAVVIVGADEKTYTIQNSWGRSWANNGLKKFIPCDTQKEMLGVFSVLMSPYKFNHQTGLPFVI